VAATRSAAENITYTRLELDGVKYIVLRETLFERLCERAGMSLESDVGGPTLPSGLPAEPASLTAKLKRRRQATGLSQAELARRAGVRPETLNRIERGRTMPDFATIRKLVIAMDAAERESTDPPK